jgi:diguanylate cyclase (GGDEF)-like protein
MSSHENAIEGRRGRSVASRFAALILAIYDIPGRVRESEYQQVGQSPRFRAIQRRRVRSACRVGFLVAAAAVGFDLVALFGLQGGHTTVAIALSGATILIALVGWWMLPRRLRRYPEVAAWIVTMGLAITTAATGVLIPSLVVQTAGYLLVIPGLVALLLPWRTRTHVGWLFAYTLVAVAYFSLDPNGAFAASERSDLVVVLLVALGASMAGHVMLQASQIRSFAQLESIRALQRRAADDMVELERVHHALELTARTDPLTGAGNRRRLDEDLRAVRAHINRSGFVYGLVEIDLDRFKLVNDLFGHGAGDEVLRRVVTVIQATLRANDAVYRLGGEEFLVLLSVPTIDGLRSATERLRIAVMALDIEHPGNPPYDRVTVSMGGSMFGQIDLSLTDEEWLHRIDAALYRAKDAGRNRVELIAPLPAVRDIAETA